jgi:hypothetical protein
MTMLTVRKLSKSAFAPTSRSMRPGFSAGLSEAENQMLWASYTLRTLICEKIWHGFAKSDELMQEAHDLLLTPGLPLQRKHMFGLNQYAVANHTPWTP